MQFRQHLWKQTTFSSEVESKPQSIQSILQGVELLENIKNESTSRNNVC